MSGRMAAAIDRLKGTDARSRLADARKLLAFVWQRFSDDRCFGMAASLSYTTLLAVVPLTAIAFAMLAAFPVFEGLRSQFQEALFSNFLPAAADAVRDYFDRFVENTNQLTAVGVLGLAVTAILLLWTVESDLNTIFRVGRPRPLVPRLLVFWALITLGPLLLGASFSLSTYFFALTRWVGSDTFSHSVDLMGNFVPTLILVVFLTLFYATVPNRRIHLRDAVIGAVVAGVLFALLRRGFGLYIANFPAYQTVYGAISAVPIFLIWMYLSWTVVLLGAVLTAVLCEWRTGTRQAGVPPAERRLEAALEVLSAVQHAKGGASREDILAATRLDGATLDRLLADFQRESYADRTESRKWVLVRDLSTVTLYDLVRMAGLAVKPTDTDLKAAPWRVRLAEELEGLARVQQKAAAVPLDDLLAEDDDRQTKGGAPSGAPRKADR